MNLGNYTGRPYTGERYCRVLVAAVLADCGIGFPATDDPGEAAGWERVERPGEGDVVVFNIAGRPGHVGVCDGRGGFLHCEEGRTSVIDRLSSPLWGSRIEGYYRCMR
ncbi:NlpC/P60 family protein [Pseudoxanthomonas sp. USHLN014]|uniref:NlpC/P60 family protein n=1 Tax=Pseudoxanthomonas sp. USHLN014 TaxID=3081297 RepID=UPI00301C96B8